MENIKNSGPENQNEKKELTLEERVKVLEAEKQEFKAKFEAKEIENKELKDKSENLKQLLTIVAHDLRSPVGNTTVFIDHLLEGIKNSSITEKELVAFLEMISKQSRSTFKLLEELLVWIRLQKDGINPEIMPRDLRNQVEDSIDPLLSVAQVKNIKLENAIKYEDSKVLADSMMLQTIIRNLTSNAIKYTNKDGNISISSEKKGDFVNIYIKDDGVGLSEEAREKIFDVLGTSIDGTEGEKGTRFGLQMCKEYAEKMNGTIQVESEGEGRGTRFIVTLPSGDKSVEK